MIRRLADRCDRTKKGALRSLTSFYWAVNSAKVYVGEMLGYFGFSPTLYPVDTFVRLTAAIHFRVFMLVILIVALPSAFM